MSESMQSKDLTIAIYIGSSWLKDRVHERFTFSNDYLEDAGFPNQAGEILKAICTLVQLEIIEAKRKEKQ